MAIRGEISEEFSTKVDERLYVAVGKDLKENKSIILWALHNSRGKGICILHVHEPAQWIPMMGTKFLASQLEEHQVIEYRDIERKAMNNLLQNYILICEKAGVQASTLYIEMNSIEKGIIELITRNGIRKLVMGAASDKYYSKKMMEPKSKKAIYVCQNAPSPCHIWFICKGNIVHTREGKLDGAIINIASSILQTNQNGESIESSFSMSQSVSEEGYGQLHLLHSGPNYRRATSEILIMENINFSPNNSFGGASPVIKSSPDRILFSDCNERSPMSDLADGSYMPLLIENHHRNLSPPSVLEGDRNEELYDQLEQAMAEADNSRREAFEESMKRRKAEKEIIDVIRRGRTSETLLSEEMHRRKETEEALARGNLEIKKMKQQLDEIMGELCEAQEQIQSLERQIVDSEGIIHELEQKMFSSVELLQKYKKERDDLEVECENAIKVAEELKIKQVFEALSTSKPQCFSDFSLSEIEEATNYFDQSLKIAEGAYGCIYRGFIRRTQVAIKILQVASDFEQEVSFLSKLRHPNLVTLIGACQEASALIYEYLPNGTLQDRLDCKDNTPPLSWQTRIRIATELCSVLIFLHSFNPHTVMHGDLNPSNIYLDTNYVSKIRDFRINRIFIQNKASSRSTTFCCMIDHSEANLAYMDPEFVSTRELTPESDVYSFGIILLRLLTGKSVSGIINEVQSAFGDGYLNDLLDHTAGDWPFVQAKQLAHLAIRCCEINIKDRPDLASEVSRVLETMGFSCGALSPRLSSEEHSQIPHYFVCPIFQEIMQDPHVAADGFTYELEALKGWLDSGHDTSPMTNLKLPHHNLIPNRALRSAIQEWQQK